MERLAASVRIAFDLISEVVGHLHQDLAVRGIDVYGRLSPAPQYPLGCEFTGPSGRLEVDESVLAQFVQQYRTLSAGRIGPELGVLPF